MLKIVALAEKRPDITREEFERYWDNEHTELVNQLPQLRKYTNAPAVKPEQAAYDGVSELYFDTTDDIKEAFDSELGRRIREDEDEFCSNAITFVVDERVNYNDLDSNDW